MAFVPSLIPLPESALLARWETARVVLGSHSPLGSVRQAIGNHPIEGVGHLLYSASAADAEQTTLGLDAMTGDVSLWHQRSRDVPQSVGEERRLHALSDDQLLQRARTLLAQIYPRPSVLNVVWIIRDHGLVSDFLPDGTFKQHQSLPDRADVMFAATAPNGAILPHRCALELRCDTGDLIASTHTVYRAQTVSPVPTYGHDDALAIARYRITEGKPVPIALTLVRDYNAVQRQNDAFYDSYKNEPELVVEEDEWLHQRLVWRFYFNVGTYRMDAHTGEYLGYGGNPIRIPDEVRYPRERMFALPQPATVPRPAKLPPEPTPIDIAEVNFNGEDLQTTSSSSARLHYPPIVREHAPLVYADYFPQFAITTQVRGKNITLEGQVAGKRTVVQLHVGKRTVIVDNTKVDLPTAPVLRDKRLYLPASLLQIVGGVPIRWDAIHNLLTVNTQTLRRSLTK